MKRTFFINHRICQSRNDKQIDKKRFIKRLFASSLRIFRKEMQNQTMFSMSIV